MTAWCGRSVESAIFITTEKTMRYQRAGVTIIELLVVIAIVMILLSLSAAAVMVVRGQSHRADCASRQRQLALATHAYCATHGKLPGSLSRRSRTISGFLDLAPHLEAQNAVDLLDEQDWPEGVMLALSRGLELPRNLNAAIPPTLQCPIGQAADGRSNYVMNGGYGRLGVTDLDGVFAYPDQVVRLDDIAGGASQTVAFAERVQGVRAEELSRLIDTDDKSWSAARQICYDGEAPPGSVGPMDFYGCRWWFGGIGFNAYNHLIPPNRPACQYGNLGTSFHTASSYHSGGINVAFVDGHTDFIGDSIDKDTWYHLGTRAAD